MKQGLISPNRIFKMAPTSMLLNLCIVFLVAITSIVFQLFNSEQPGPYMDEIFHIPQAQNYCIGNLSHWNNKITTLPGLYIISLMMLRLCNFAPFLGRFMDQEQPCSTMFLRSVNVIFMLLNLYLLYELTFIINFNYQLKTDAKRLQKEELEGKKKRKEVRRLAEMEEEGKISAKAKLLDHALANGLVLSLFPVLYFFTFLYYTDQGSTLMVLFTYWLSLNESHTTAALTGAVAVCLRQTNVIWVAFAAGNVLIKELGDEPEIENGVLQYLNDVFFAIMQRLGSLVQKLLPYILVGIGFCIFVIKNNGIVVGDHSSHQASFNFPQMFYFVSLTMFCSFPMFISLKSMKTAKDKLGVITSSKKTTFCSLICIAVLALLINKFTYVHEYLLADNRHYTFYIWRKIFQRHWIVKYLAIPCYIYGMFVMAHQLISRNSVLFVILFINCVALVTIPQKLLEFRYFIIPFLIFRLHAPLPSPLSLLLEAALYITVNCLTVLLFLYKPFHWENSPDVQRFMW